MASYYCGFLVNDEPHFLESCHLCLKPLGLSSDIYMYRGDRAFCSEECRQEEIESDEAKEKRWRKASRSLRKSAEDKDSGASKNVRTGTLMVA